MSTNSVAPGWQHILHEAIAEAAALPEEWCFEIVRAETVDGALKISATYVAGDVPLDDHLPPSQKIPHPYRSFLRIREMARAKSRVTCECCGRIGRMNGDDARVRCPAHVDVVDAMSWQQPEGVLFASDEEAMAHFLGDYGDGVDFIQEQQAAGAQDPDAEDSEKSH